MSTPAPFSDLQAIAFPPEIRGSIVASDAILVIGQRLRHSSRFGSREGIIVAIHGEQTPETCGNLAGVIITGGQADFQIVYEDGEQSRVPEAIFRCQRSGDWAAYSALATPEQITAAGDLVTAAKEKHQKDTQDAKIASEERTAELRRQHPELDTAEKSDLSTYARGAKNIRTQLRDAFPGIKFSVRSSSFAGGCAIDIDWTDGPASDLVEKITSAYSQGRFDGMDDSYEYNRDEWPRLFGGAKYVHATRKISDAIRERIGRRMCDFQNIAYDGDNTRHLYGEHDCDYLSTYIHRATHAVSFPADTDPDEIDVDMDCGDVLILHGDEYLKPFDYSADENPDEPETRQADENSSPVKHLVPAAIITVSPLTAALAALDAI